MTSYKSDPDLDGKVIQALEDVGLSVEPGGSPMVDWEIVESTDL